MSKIDNNPEAKACMDRMFPSIENRVRSIYNMGYKDGYSDAVKEATDKLYAVITGTLDLEDEDE